MSHTHGLHARFDLSFRDEHSYVHRHKNKKRETPWMFDREHGREIRTADFEERAFSNGE